MKFKAYKTAFCKEIPESVIIDADPVRLAIRVESGGRCWGWEIKGNNNGKVLASSNSGHILEIYSI